MGIYLDFATGFNLPPFWLDHPVHVLTPGRASENFPVSAVGDDSTDKMSKSECLNRLFQDEVRVKLEDEINWWNFPLDPVVSVSGKNIIVRRNVAKIGEHVERRGSVKETWSVDDYEINIAGVLMNGIRMTDKQGELPEADLRKLRKYCEARKPLMVEGRLFTLFGITRLAIVDYALPFTKGVENQMYTIKAYSDDDVELLIRN